MEKTIFDACREKKATKQKAAANSPFRAFRDVTRMYLNNTRVMGWCMGYILQRLEKESERIAAICYTRINGVSTLRVTLKENLKRIGLSE